MPIAAAIAIAGVPQILDRGEADGLSVHLAATWLGVVLAMWHLTLRPKVSCGVRLDEWGTTVMRRALRAAGSVWIATYFVHLVGWMAIFDIEWTPLHLVPVLLAIALKSRHESMIWASGALAVMSTLVGPAGVWMSALAVAVIFAWQARDTARDRLWVGAVIALHFAARTLGWQGGPPPPSPWWLSLATATMLIYLAIRLRPTTALLALAVAAVGIWQYLPRLGALGWGIVFLASGFFSLITGIAINWLKPALRR